MILLLLSHQYCTQTLVVVKTVAIRFEDFHACKLDLCNNSKLRIFTHSIPMWNLCITCFRFDQKILWCIKSILTHHWISSGYIDYFPYFWKRCFMLSGTVPTEVAAVIFSANLRLDFPCSINFKPLVQSSHTWDKQILIRMNTLNNWYQLINVMLNRYLLHESNLETPHLAGFGLLTSILIETLT